MRRPLPWDRGGLVPLTRVHAANNAGDALVAVSLAGTLFFSVPIGEARGRVALYLLTTMAPFALIAPVVGPVLDHFRSGRRTAIAISLIARSVVAWLMSGGGGLRLYPAAFAVLVLSKGYGLARAAAVPRLLDQNASLVGGNARLSATGIVCSSVAASVGAGLTALTDSRWTLRVASVVFVAAALFATRLPAAVNSPRIVTDGDRTRQRVLFTGRARSALLGALTLRMLSGFLTMFLAFLLKGAGQGQKQLALVIGGAAIGAMLGTGVGALLRRNAPEWLLAGSLVLATLACIVGARSFSLGTAVLVAGCAGLSNGLGKLALDAILQRDVADSVRGQTFARSETTLQLAWVFGGGLGVALPRRGTLGLGLAAAALVIAAVPLIVPLLRRHHEAVSP